MGFSEKSNKRRSDYEEKNKFKKNNYLQYYCDLVVLHSPSLKESICTKSLHLCLHIFHSSLQPKSNIWSLWSDFHGTRGLLRNRSILVCIDFNAFWPSMVRLHVDCLPIFCCSWNNYWNPSSKIERWISCYMYSGFQRIGTTHPLELDKSYKRAHGNYKHCTSCILWCDHKNW